MRNILLIHLESLNYITYKLHPEFFPNLNRLEKESLSFSRYYTTATSTLMVVADIVYGQLEQYERCKSLIDVPEIYPSQNSLLDELKAKGYNAHALINLCGVDQIGAEKRHLLGFDITMNIKQKHEEHMQDVRGVIENDEPFVLMVCNHIPNVGYHRNLPNGWAESGLDRLEHGYRFMDQYVKEIVDLVESNGKLENTTIVFYGDHGDEFFWHGYHAGLTHAFEPYGSTVHTPLWIYDSRAKGGDICSELVDASDLRTVVRNLLDIKGDTFEWSEFAVPEREFSFARSSYVAQPIREESFGKGYSLTDGRFFMLVTNKGLEFYDLQTDEMCQNNLLRFFVLEDGILHINDAINAPLKFHYKEFMNRNSIRQIRQTYYYFRNALKEKVTELYASAGYADNVSEMNFDKINYK